MAGGVAHNAGQIIVAIFVTGVHQIAWYFPILCLTGTAAGVGIGLVSALILRQTEHLVF